MAKRRGETRGSIPAGLGYQDTDFEGEDELEELSSLVPAFFAA